MSTDTSPEALLALCEREVAYYRQVPSVASYRASAEMWEALAALVRLTAELEQAQKGWRAASAEIGFITTRAERAEAALAVAQQERDAALARAEKAEQERDGARRERDAAHAHACENSIEERNLRAERDTLQQSLAEKQRLIQQVEWTLPCHDGLSYITGCPWCRESVVNRHAPDCPAFGQQATSPETPT